ncbi:DUF3267 domain-containing protein [Chloroflexus sp.]|uniref:DUF3267 domain-containing protein n=1 Tax=Chloroflexus sp. TaxID=1904827 RepID=UPI002ADD3FE5|nr:DUF3267 domain-containing protein [Chloroflexus sp.]
MQQPDNYNYQRFDRSTSLEKANLVGSLFGLIPAIVLIVGHLLYNGEFTLTFNPNDWFGIILLIIIVIGGVLVHELLHVIGWMLAGRVSLSAMKLGFDRKTLTPYAHSRQALPINAYRFGIILPAIVLGLLPGLIGIIGNLPLYTAFGAFFTLAAGGDLLILWLLRRDPAQALVIDHSDRVGCELLIPNESNSR